MANQTVQIFPAQEVEGIDECSENIPPGVIAVPGTFLLKDQDGDVSRCSSVCQSGETDPHSAFSTLTPTSRNPKMGISGFHSAMTPILKQLTIHNKCSSSPSRGITVANSWSIAGSNQPSNTGIAGDSSRRSVDDVNAPMCWLADECLPEVTFLDVTNDSMLSTPVTTDIVHTCNTPNSFINKKPDVIQCSVSKKPLCKQSGKGTVSETSSNNHQTPQHTHTSRLHHATEEHARVAEDMMSGKGNMMVDVPESVEAPLRWLDDRYFPEITLLDVTRDFEFSPNAQMPSLEVMQDIPVGGVQSNLPSPALGGKAEADPGTQNTVDSEDLSSMLDGNVTDATMSVCEQSDKCVTKSTPNISLEVTRDISNKSALEDSQPSVSSGKCTEKIQTSIEGTPGVHPLNVTRDISSSSDLSVSRVALCDLGATSANVTANGQELLTSQLISKLSEQSPKSIGSVNRTFTVVQQNNTFILKSSDENGTITISETSSSDSQHSALDRPFPQKLYHSAKSPKQGFVEAPPPATTKQYEMTVTLSDTRTLNNHETESNLAVEAAFAGARLETKGDSHPCLPMKDGSPDPSGHHSLETDERKANTFNLDDTLDLRADSLITSTPMVTCKMFNFSTEREEGKTVMAAQKKLSKDGPSQPNHLVRAEVPSNIAVKSLLPSLKTASQLLKHKSASTLPGRPGLAVSGLPVTRQKTQAATLRNTDPSQVTTGKPVPYDLRPTTTGSRQSTGLPHPRPSSVQTGIQRAAQGLRPPLARSNGAASWSTDNLRGPTVTNPATKISQPKKHPLTRGESLPTAKRKKMDASSQLEASTASCAASNRTKTLKPPTAAPKLFPAKATRVDAAIPASNAEASSSSSSSSSSSCNAVSRVRAWKQHVTTHKALLPKPQNQSCVRCGALQLQLDAQSEEIRRLKDELMKYSQPHEEC